MSRRYAAVILIFSIISLFFVSCQKEVSGEIDRGAGAGSGSGGGSGSGSGGGTGNTSIIGDYDFVGMTAHTLSTVTVTAAGDQLKTVTTSDYITKNNVGTVRITATQFITTGFAYSIDTVMNGKTYVNGALVSDQNLP